MTRVEDKKILNVLIVTPLGRGGKGGIDRIMDNIVDCLELQRDADIRVEVAVSRGQNHIVYSPFLMTLLICRLIFRRLVGKQPDLVHINLSLQGSTIRKIIISKVLSFLNIPYVIHLHGHSYEEYWDQAPKWLSSQIYIMFANASGIIVLGTRWKEYIAKRVPSALDRLYMLPNATPSYNGSSRSVVSTKTRDEVKILFLGEVGNRKGVPQLIDALAQLKTIPAWRAIIAGNGDVGRFRLQAKRLALDGRVSFPGWLSPDDTAQELASADILTLPSFSENLPMSVIEGMGAGLAVVTTPVGATPDIIKDGENGLLVAVGDTAELTDALRRLIQDKDLRLRLSTAAKKYHKENLEIGSYVERLKGIWKKTCADPQRKKG